MSTRNTSFGTELSFKSRIRKRKDGNQYSLTVPKLYFDNGQIPWDEDMEYKIVVIPIKPEVEKKIEELYK